jgi:hypothetical protein
MELTIKLYTTYQDYIDSEIRRIYTAFMFIWKAYRKPLPHTQSARQPSFLGTGPPLLFAPL